MVWWGWGGSGFPPRWPGQVAQLAERAAENREVTGSTPVLATGWILLVDGMA